MNLLAQRKQVRQKLVLQRPKLKRNDELLDDYDIADFVIDQVFDDVSIYLNVELDEIPDQLLNTMTLMCVELVDRSGFGKSQEEIDDELIETVKEGDVTVTRSTSAEKAKIIASLPSVSHQFERKMNQFRRLKPFG